MPKIDAKIEADRRREAAYLQRLEAFKALRQKELEAFKALRQKELPGMEKYINQHIPILLGAWQQQVNSAITDAPYPSQEQSRVFWYIALGGNLLWAATCFINPASGAIVIMSVVGAAVGSGGVEKLYGSPPTNLESAKDLVRQQVAKARGELEKHFQKKLANGHPGFLDSKIGARLTRA